MQNPIAQPSRSAYRVDNGMSGIDIKGQL